MRSFTAILIAVVAAWPSFVLANGTIELVVVSGADAPAEDGTLETFGVPLLNAGGKAAFSATLSGTDGGDATNMGVFLGDGDGLVEIVRKGDPEVSGTDDFVSFSRLLLDDADQVAFQAILNDGSPMAVDHQGIFIGSGGVLTQIAREGVDAPDTSGTNGTFALFFAGMSLNASGGVAFQSFIDGTLAAPADESGIFLSNGSSITQIVRAGGDAPVSPESFGTIAIGPVVNDAGQVAFKSLLRDTSGGLDDDEGLFRGDGSSIVEMVREGQSAAGNGSFGGAGNAFSGYALNSSGDVTFIGRASGTNNGSSDDEGIFQTDGNTLIELIRENDASPDGNGQLSSFSTFVANNQGQVALAGNLRNTSGLTFDDRGVFRADGDTLDLVAREGQPAPTAIASDGSFSRFNSLAINDAGQVAIDADLRDTSDGSQNNRGIFLLDDDRGLVPVVRKGDSLASSTIIQIDFAGRVSLSEDTSTGLNDDGQVAFRFNLQNGNQGIGIFTLDPLPENTGDFNGDGIINAADYIVWRNTFDTAVAAGTGADASGNGLIDQDDYDIWKMNFGMAVGSGSISFTLSEAIPEPGSLVLVLLAGVAGVAGVGRGRLVGRGIQTAR